ncbi:unnamed protein product [Ascophyllum nodosum]
MNSRLLLGRSASPFSFSWLFTNASRPATAVASGRTFAFQASLRGTTAKAIYSIPLNSPRRSIWTTRTDMSGEVLQGEVETTAAATPVAENLEDVRQRVRTATDEAGEGRALPRLVAVSKTKPVEDLQAAYDAGQRIFGENYAQELIEKCPKMPQDVVWHFIGHLQSNKAKALVADVPNLSVLETLDTSKLATKLQQAACESAGRELPLGVFIQIDTSGEEAKSGIHHTDVDGCLSLCRHLKDSCPSLELKGLMTIGAPGDMECFNRLCACRDAVAAGLGLEPQVLELSMGMSGDFEEAIRRGSTNVRVGSTIFGARFYPNKKT